MKSWLLVAGAGSLAGLGFLLLRRGPDAFAGAWSPETECRRHLGRRPPTVWDSTDRVADEIERGAPVGLDALDPGSDSLRDTFCRRLVLKGRCPTGKGGWRKALKIALSHGGERSYERLDTRTAWRLLNDAYKEQTGKTLPLPEGTERLREYDENFDRCVRELDRDPPF